MGKSWSRCCRKKKVDEEGQGPGKEGEEAGDKGKWLGKTIRRLKSKMHILKLSRREVSGFMKDCGSDGTIKVLTDPEAKAIEFERLRPNEKQ